MKEVYAEGTKFLYLTKSEELPETGSEVLGLKIGGAPQQNFWAKIRATGLTDVRLAIMTFAITSKEGYVYALHWDDGTDLEELDRRVTLNEYSDEDFVNSIKTQVCTTKCFECDWEGLTLVVTSTNPYLNAPNLAKQKEQRRHQREGFISTCPVCNARLRQSVVKIFE